MADAHHRRAFFLSLALARVDRLADVGDRHVAQELHATGVLVHLDLGRRHPDLPERSLAAEHRMATLAAIRPATDQLAAGPEVSCQRLGVRALARRGHDGSVAQLHRCRIAPELASAEGEELISHVARRSQYRKPHQRRRAARARRLIVRAHADL